MTSTASEVKRAFREHGLSPKKWMGQNLLTDPGYLKKIVRAARVQPGEPLVEVGAGLGVLTAALLAEGALVWALEIDSGFFRVLENRFSGTPGLTLIHADALKYDFRGLARELGKLRVVANLPYNVSSRLIFLFHEHRDLFGSLTIMLQKEVAERLTAPPATKDYGVLTVLLGVTAEVEILFDVPGKAFYPVPKVVSSVVRIVFPDEPPVPVSDPVLLRRIVKASFTGRRKTLRNCLRRARMPGVSFDRLLEAASTADIDLARRGETLSPEEFARFADAVGAPG
jgi:16S rRNA (adenine1518-N6/adenine1519-N6)-dimethyltransferase